MQSTRSTRTCSPLLGRVFHRLDERVVPMCSSVFGERLQRMPMRVSSSAGVQDAVFAGGSSPT